MILPDCANPLPAALGDNDKSLLAVDR